MMQMTDDYFPAEVPAPLGRGASLSPTATRPSRRPALWVRPSPTEPMDMPIGRFAGMIDPQGASFTVMQPAAGG